MNNDIEKSIIAYYYDQVYPKIWNDNFALGVAEKIMEVSSPVMQINTLEIGGGSGEHLRFVKNFPEKNYVSLDPRTLDKEFLLKMSRRYKRVRFVQGSVEDIPFANDYFDHIKSMCVLAHVDRLLISISELRRVSANNCRIIILMPTDPGLLNLLIKKLFTYPRINRISKFPAGLIYSLDHKNSHNNILEVLKFVFSEDYIKISYLPFLFKSTNFNLLSIVKITVRK